MISPAPSRLAELDRDECLGLLGSSVAVTERHE
jgi:hypothetical protein